MKKLNLLLVLIFIFLVLLNSYSVRASFDKNKLNEIDSDLLQALLLKRIEIMNKGLYNCGDINPIIEELKTIEKGSILENDIISLNEAFSNPTDYPMIINARIKDVKLIDFNESIYNLISTVEWKVSYNLEDKIEEYEYIIQIENQDNKYILIDFKLKE